MLGPISGILVAFLYVCGSIFIFWGIIGIAVGMRKKGVQYLLLGLIVFGNGLILHQSILKHANPVSLKQAFSFIKKQRGPTSLNLKF